MVTIRIPIEPVPFARAGSKGKQRFTPEKQKNFMGQIRLFASQAMAGRPLFEGPLEMSATFVYEQPASWSKIKKASTKWKDSRSDVDNLAKCCMDAFNACVYHDDAQIASLFAQKLYGPYPEIIVTVRELEPIP
jgi:Holliday junction resolvase RusA-like endonuclease